MTAPPLPDIFGNYALREFVEVVAPDSISWLPQTVGWLWLGVALLALAARHLWRGLKHWYHNRYRREAIARLQALTNHSLSVADINRVLKITAVVAYSREEVAKLSGEGWVTFLNHQCEHPPFGQAHMQLLATSSYRQQKLGQASLQTLMQASLLWVNQHRAAGHV